MENITSEPAPVTITEIGSLKSKNINLWEKLLEAINRQFEEQNIIMTQGRIKIIDSTSIEAAQSGPDKDKNGVQKKDSEAGKHVKKDAMLLTLYGLAG